MKSKSPLRGVADRFLSFVMSYAEHFISYRRDVSEKARQYASGLMQAGSRKNIYAISEVVPDTDQRNLQQLSLTLNGARVKCLTMWHMMPMSHREYHGRRTDYRREWVCQTRQDVCRRQSSISRTIG